MGQFHHKKPNQLTYVHFTVSRQVKKKEENGVFFPPFLYKVYISINENGGLCPW